MKRLSRARTTFRDPVLRASQWTTSQSPMRERWPSDEMVPRSRNQVSGPHRDQNQGISPPTFTLRRAFHSDGTVPRSPHPQSPLPGQTQTHPPRRKNRSGQNGDPSESNCKNSILITALLLRPSSPLYLKYSALALCTAKIEIFRRPTI
jgi:hypothetical protein